MLDATTLNDTFKSNIFFVIRGIRYVQVHIINKYFCVISDLEWDVFIIRYVKYIIRLLFNCSRTWKLWLKKNKTIQEKLYKYSRFFVYGYDIRYCKPWEYVYMNIFISFCTVRLLLGSTPVIPLTHLSQCSYDGGQSHIWSNGCVCVWETERERER